MTPGYGCCNITFGGNLDARTPSMSQMNMQTPVLAAPGPQQMANPVLVAPR
jgi:hypothetical protein